MIDEVAAATQTGILDNNGMFWGFMNNLCVFIFTLPKFLFTK